MTLPAILHKTWWSATWIVAKNYDMCFLDLTSHLRNLHDYCVVISGGRGFNNQRGISLVKNVASFNIVQFCGLTRFGKPYCLQMQGWNLQRVSGPSAFNPENSCNIFLMNVDANLQNYKVPRPIRQQSERLPWKRENVPSVGFICVSFSYIVASKFSVHNRRCHWREKSRPRNNSHGRV